MKRLTLTATVLATVATTSLGLWIACANQETLLDEDAEKRLDFAVALPDLSSFDFTTAADLTQSDSGHEYSCRGTDAPGTTYKLVTDSLRLPKSSGSLSYTYDFDGNGKPENQLRNLTQALAFAGLDLQSGVDEAVAKGASLQLASVTTSDLSSASCAGVSLMPAKPTLMLPRFDGSDILERAMTPAADLIGKVSAGKLTTKATKDLLPKEEARAELSLSLGRRSLTLPLRGLHMEGTLEKMGTLLRIRDGVLHGVVSAMDIDTKVLPAVADQVTLMINSDPMSPTTTALINLFENMSNAVTKTKCMKASQCCHVNPTTCFIMPEEVKLSPLGAVLAPDVEVFDSSGEWKPVPDGRNRNGVSLGVGFSAITASFP